MHVWQNPVMVAVFAILVGLLVFQEIHKRRQPEQERLRKRVAREAIQPPAEVGNPR